MYKIKRFASVSQTSSLPLTNVATNQSVMSRDTIALEQQLKQEKLRFEMEKLQAQRQQFQMKQNQKLNNLNKNQNYGQSQEVDNSQNSNQKDMLKSQEVMAKIQPKPSGNKVSGVGITPNPELIGKGTQPTPAIPMNK